MLKKVDNACKMYVEGIYWLLDILLLIKEYFKINIENMQIINNKKDKYRMNDKGKLFSVSDLNKLNYSSKSQFFIDIYGLNDNIDISSKICFYYIKYLSVIISKKDIINKIKNDLLNKPINEIDLEIKELKYDVYLYLIYSFVFTNYIPDITDYYSNYKQ